MLAFTLPLSSSTGASLVLSERVARIVQAADKAQPRQHDTPSRTRPRLASFYKERMKMWWPEETRAQVAVEVPVAERPVEKVPLKSPSVDQRHVEDAPAAKRTVQESVVQKPVEEVLSKEPVAERVPPKEPVAEKVLPKEPVSEKVPTKEPVSENVAPKTPEIALPKVVRETVPKSSMLVQKPPEVVSITKDEVENWIAEGARPRPKPFYVTNDPEPAAATSAPSQGAPVANSVNAAMASEEKPGTGSSTNVTQNSAATTTGGAAVALQDSAPPSYDKNVVVAAVVAGFVSLCISFGHAAETLFSRAQLF